LMSKNYKVNIMKILVTGFSGFIGKHLLERLNQTNHELILMDLANGFDICDWEQVKQVENVDFIVHLANLSFVPASYENPKKFYKINYLSTLNMLELCRINHDKMISSVRTFTVTLNISPLMRIIQYRRLIHTHKLK